MKLLAGLLFVVLLSLAQPKRPVQGFETSAGMLKITPIQHASLMIEAGGQVIHRDHMDPKILSKIAKSGSMILAPAAVAETLKNATVIRNGETKNAGPFTIEAVPMYNLKRGPAPGKLFHDRGRGNGYIVTYGGKRFYFSGDTESIPEMRALKNIDVAFVCMNLPYTMPPDEAAEAVRAFHPKIVYPYHYRGSDLSVFQKALAGSGSEVRILDWYYKG